MCAPLPPWGRRPSVLDDYGPLPDISQEEADDLIRDYDESARRRAHPRRVKYERRGDLRPVELFPVVSLTAGPRYKIALNNVQCTGALNRRRYLSNLWHFLFVFSPSRPWHMRVNSLLSTKIQSYRAWVFHVRVAWKVRDTGGSQHLFGNHLHPPHHNQNQNTDLLTQAMWVTRNWSILFNSIRHSYKTYTSMAIGGFPMVRICIDLRGNYDYYSLRDLYGSHLR